MIHSLPLVNAFYIAPFMFFSIILRKSSRKKYLPFMVFTSLFLGVVAIFTLSSLNTPSENTLQFIKDFHDRIWKGSLSNSYATIPAYFQKRLGENLVLIAAAGFIASFFIEIRHKYWLYLSMLMVVIIILNSKYWFLPLSPVLWPDRIVTLSTVALSYFVSCFIFIALNLVNKIFKVNSLITAVFIILFFTIPIHNKTLGGLAFHNYREIMQDSEKLASVTQDDLNALLWISENTSPGDVIANNYGDSGIWISAISYRRVTENDIGLNVVDKLPAVRPVFQPSYLYLGSKIVYPMALMYIHKVIENDSDYKLVYSSGRARVYEIVTTNIN
jgi:hypothetical protein